MSEATPEASHETAPPPTRSSRVARIAGRVGIAAPSLAVIGIGLAQLGAPPLLGFALFALAVLVGLIALVLGGIGIFLTGGDATGRRRAFTGVGLGILMIAAVLVGRGPQPDAPAVNDVATDLRNPPTFAPRDDRDMRFPPPMFAESYSDEQYRDLLRTAYPDLEPIPLESAPDAVYEAAVAQAEAMGWTITRQDPEAGVFEAEDETALFRFVDDVVVRVRADVVGSVVDLRSKSRDGRGDIGKNAARIRAFREGLRERLS